MAANYIIPINDCTWLMQCLMNILISTYSIDILCHKLKKCESCDQLIFNISMSCSSIIIAIATKHFAHETTDPASLLIKFSVGIFCMNFDKIFANLLTLKDMVK